MDVIGFCVGLIRVTEERSILGLADPFSKIKTPPPAANNVEFQPSN